MSRPEEMTHPEEGTLLALLDGELHGPERARAESHLGTCAECAALLRDLKDVRTLFGGAVAKADVPAPAEWALHSVRRRQARRGSGVEVRRALLRAAVFVLAFGGVAYAAVPGSPVRAWVSRIVAPAATPAPEPRLKPAPAPVAVPVERAPAGVSIAPEEGVVHVVLSGSGPDLRVRARVSDEARATVFATGEAAGARFRTGPGRVEVVGARAGEITVTLPRGARSAVVEADGRVLLSREGERVRVMAPAVGRSGQEMVFRARP
jgi:anti-sigma factor RsiW